MTLKDWIDRYNQAGISTIPLKEKTKLPALKGWQTLPSDQLWDRYQSPQANIGVRTGAGLAVIDGDDNYAVSQIREFNKGLGLQPAEVLTKRGAHFYYPVQSSPDGFYSRNLKDIPGELKAGAQVVAPCSVVGDHAYRFLVGSPEMIKAIPAIAWQDLAVLIPDLQTDPKKYLITELPVRLIYREMPTKAADLLRWLRTATKGESVTYGNKTYPTRSEAEAAVIDILALAGWNYEQIHTIFQQSMPAHYVSVSDQVSVRERYLRRVYNSAITDLANTGIRPNIANAYKAALLSPYSGRAGASDKAITLALISQGWVWNTFEPIASLRDIQEHTGNIGSTRTVYNALNRMKQQGLIKPVSQSIYDITKLITHTIDNFGSDLPDHANQISIDQAPVFRASVSDGLGFTAGLIYDHLINAPDGLSVSNLIDLTGKSENTIRAQLRSLQSSNLVGVIDTNKQALIYGIAESIGKVSAEYQVKKYLSVMRNTHAYQRSTYQEMIAKSKQNKNTA